MIKDSVSAVGKLSIVLTDQNGNVKQQFETSNLVVAAGKNLIASRLGSNTQSVLTHMAVGTGTAAPLAGNTELGAEISGSRVALVTSGGTVTDNNLAFGATFGVGVGTGSIAETGIFNAGSGGTMLCRTTFPPVNKSSSDTLSISWNVTIS